MKKTPHLKKNLAWLVAAIALALIVWSIVHHRNQDSPPTQHTWSQPINVDTNFDRERACPAWRKVGIKNDAETVCPKPAEFGTEEWDTSPLFKGSSLPKALEPFCLYEASPSDPTILSELNINLNDLVTQGRLERVDSTCAAVTTAADPKLPDQIWEKLRDHFLEQAGAVQDLTTLDSIERSVRLALIDTEPASVMVDNNVPQRNSEHGYTVKRLAQSLLCFFNSAQEERCAAQISTYLGLPIEKFTQDAITTDSARGGFYGSVDQLALAVYQALDDLADNESLVINLSVAWDRAHTRDGDQINELTAPTLSLYKALQVASCRGALIIAATGNRKGGFDESAGPLLPGGWELESAPKPLECIEIASPNNDNSGNKDSIATENAPETPDEPLVYAVSGVHTENTPLVNARKRSESSLVAYADHAVAASDWNDGPTAILTGSSVATIVVAATAAAVWATEGVSRRDVVKKLYNTGSKLARNAEFHHSSAELSSDQERKVVHRIKLCQALNTCNPRPTSSVRPVLAPWLATSHTQGSGLQTVVYDDQTWVEAAKASTCPDRRIFYDPMKLGPIDPCPTLQYYGVMARPWMYPQPTTNPCSGCDIDLPPVAAPNGRIEQPMFYNLYLEIDEDWNGGELSNAYLDIGNRSLYLSLYTPLEQGDRVLVKNVNRNYIDLGKTKAPVVLRFTVNPGPGKPLASVEAPVFISR